MMPFMAISALLGLIALAWVVYPLMRSPHGAGQRTASPPLPGLATALAAILLLITAGLYAMIGNHAAWQGPIPVSPLNAEGTGSDGPDDTFNAAISPDQVTKMVEKLASRLEQNPDDPEGWRMLARSYESLGRFDDAVQTYRQLIARQPPDADTLTHYAVVLGMTQGRTLVGPPEALLQQALKLAPDHVQALALLGNAAFERQDDTAAVNYWQRLLNKLPEHDETRTTIETYIAKAQQRLSKKTGRAPTR